MTMTGLVLCLKEQREGWHQALKEFCEEHANTWCFLADGVLSEADKTAMAGAIWSLIKQQQHQHGQQQQQQQLETLMHAARLLLREDGGISPLLSEEVLSFFLGLSGLTSVAHESEEALKVVINLVTRHRPNRDLAVQQYHAHAAVLLRIGGSDDEQRLFLLYRLLVQLTLEDANSAVVWTASPSAMELIARDVQRCLPPLLLLLSVDHPPLFLAEALKVLFNMTVHLGLLGTGTHQNDSQQQQKQQQEQAANAFKGVMPVVTRVLAITTQQKDNKGDKEEGSSAEEEEKQSQWDNLRRTAVSCLMNLPRSAGPNKWQQWVTTAQEMQGVVTALLWMAERAVAVTNNVDVEGLIPALLLLTDILQQSQAQQQRQTIFSAVFPPDFVASAKATTASIEGPAALATSQCLGAKLAKMMTTTLISLKHVVQEFLFAVCHNDANELVALAGLGNAAGALQAHSLFGPTTSP